MAELDPSDVEAFTGGRLSDTDDQTELLLAAALAAARRYCGWHVSPVRTDDEVVVDGPGGTVLALPTRALIDVTEVVENGVTINTSNLDVSKTKGTVEKYPRARWTSRNGAITVTMTHGYTEEQAADWRLAVLSLTDSMAQSTNSLRGGADVVRKKIDDVEYQWSDRIISTDDKLSAAFAPYRILPSP